MMTEMRKLRILGKRTLVGISLQTSIDVSILSKIERRLVMVSPKQAKAIAAALGVSVDDLFPEKQMKNERK